MLKLMFKMILAPSYHIKDADEKYGDKGTILIFLLNTILFMFLNIVIYDKALGSVFLTFKDAIINSVILGIPIGIFTLFGIAHISKLLFKMIGIKLTAKAIRSCISWGSITLLFGNIVSVIIRVITILTIETDVMFRPNFSSSMYILVIFIFTLIWSIASIFTCVKEFAYTDKINIFITVFVPIIILIEISKYLTEKIYFLIMVYL
ncbi:YIP1 family protein [Sporosalibacterium faouarense]|uniref:YIP1 family protein n=1 Tax=Sporosalibacterium faouarense TaxID=516123 RepID=UPI00192BCF4D|nr:YIP1 family protein [Sporosalibacterium faouarense]